MMGANFRASARTAPEIIDVTIHDGSDRPETVREAGISTRCYPRTIKAGSVQIDVYVVIRRWKEPRP